jgi:hypothetical protein
MDQGHVNICGFYRHGWIWVEHCTLYTEYGFEMWKRFFRCCDFNFHRIIVLHWIFFPYWILNSSRTLYFKFWNLIIREIIMSWMCDWEKKGIIQKLNHEIARKKLDGWVQRWKDYIKCIVKEMDFGSTEWIQLNWNRNKWWAVVLEVLTELNYSVMIKIGTFCVVFIAWIHFYWEKSILFIK